MASADFKPSVGSDDGHCSGNNFYDDREYLSIGNDWGTNRNGWIRFPNVNIPQGASITSCILKVKNKTNDNSTNVKWKIYFNDTGNAVAPADCSDYDNKPVTDPVEWNITEPWSAYSWHESPDLSSILQAVINRSDWQSGNALMILIKNNNFDNDDQKRHPIAVDWGDPDSVAILSVEWQSVETKTQSYNIDIEVKDQLAINYDSDLLLRTSKLNDYDIDSLLQQLNLTSSNIDLFLVKRGSKHYDFDAFLQKLNSITLASDILLKKFGKIENYDIDSLIWKSNLSILSSIDLLIQNLDVLSNYLVDCILQNKNQLISYYIETFLYNKSYVFFDGMILQLVWNDEFNNSEIDAIKRLTLAQNYNIQEFNVCEKPITLEATENQGWLTRKQVEMLYQKASVPNKTYPLIYNGKHYLVRFRWEDPPVIDVTPILPRPNMADDDYYYGTIKLMQILR